MLAAVLVRRCIHRKDAKENSQGRKGKQVGFSLRLGIPSSRLCGEDTVPLTPASRQGAFT
jgi:hypothetical protein